MGVTVPNSTTEVHWSSVALRHPIKYGGHDASVYLRYNVISA